MSEQAINLARRGGKTGWAQALMLRHVLGIRGRFGRLRRMLSDAVEGER